MKQVLISKGSAIVTEVPKPQITPGEVLVRVKASCLSIGTEMSGMQSSGIPLWKRALNQPNKAVSTVKKISTHGFRHTWKLVEEKRNAAHSTGYSAAGVVAGVGADVKGFVIGDSVGCAGNGAVHAEYICVPENLCVHLPEELDWESASTVTLGAIALQGVRRAQPTLGETFVVLGLGVLGQLTTQMLKANGCRVIGVDLDHQRISTALDLGMDYGHHPDDDDMQHVARLTNGYGADGVIITAASPSDQVVSSAFQMCRKKGRVVLVGAVGLHLNRADFYAKEIDFLISTSYGPGRYDDRYEKYGLDYPISYVRWTENRNMQEYLYLLKEDKIKIGQMITSRYPIEEASNAYASLGGGDSPLLVLLTYPDMPEEKLKRTINFQVKGKKPSGRIRIAVIGAGGFARSTHLPNIQSISDRFSLKAVVSRTGPSATSTAKLFGAEYASTDYKEILADPNIDAVIISTRHHLHASLALEALQSGKHVLVEKPLAIKENEVVALNNFITDNKDLPVLMTGYNRRFSPYANHISELVANRTAPFIFNYRMNAGYIPSDHWVHGSEGGGRNIGEACHIYDLFTFFSNSEVKNITAHAIKPQTSYYGRNDNFVATLTFADGSVTTLTYTSLGHRDHPKETAELYVDGKLAVLEDYQRLTIHGAGKLNLKTAIQQKGIKEELLAFASCIQKGTWPIPWWQQMQVFEISRLIEQKIHF